MNDTIIIKGKFNQSTLSTEKFNDTVVTVSIEGIIEDVAAVVRDGEFTATITDQGRLAARNYYNITVSSNSQTSSENYILDENTIENIVIVERAHIVADQANIVTVTYGMNDTITIKGKFNQSAGANAVKFNNTKVTVSIAGIVYTADATVEDGEFTAVITDQGKLTANTSGYDIIVSANSQTANENYTLDENTINNIVKVEKANVTAITLENITITYGVEDTITLHGVFNQSKYGDVKYNGRINVSIRDKSGNIKLINDSVEVKEGVFDADFTDKGKLSVGYYDVYVTRDDGDVNQNYTVVERTFENNITVEQAKVDATFDGAVVVWGTGTITMNGTVVKTGSGPEYSGTVYVKIGTHEYVGNVVDGILSVDVDMSVFAADKYDVVIKDNNGNVNYTVNELPLTGNVTVNKAGSDLTLDKTSDSVNYGPGSVTVTVTSLVNTTRDEATGLNFTYEIQGASQSVVSVSGNSITVNTGTLNAGTYTLKVTTVVDGNHSAAFNTTKIIVNRVPSTLYDINPISVVYGESANVTVTYIGATRVNAKLYSGETEKDVVTVAGNVITINAADLNVGTYTLTVTTVPDGNHNAVSKSATVTVTKADSTIADISPITVGYGESANVTVSYTGATDVTAELVGTTGKVSVSGNVITVSADDLNVGTYTLTVTTVPDGNHNAVSKSANVTVTKGHSTIDPISPITIVYGESGNVTVVTSGATDVVAELFSGEVKLNDTVSVAGNVITIKGDVDVGNYTLKVTTVPDANHIAVSTETNVTVTPAQSTIDSISPITIVYGESGEITVVTTGATGVDAELIGAAGSVSVAGNVITIAGADVGTYTLNVTTAPDKNHVAVSTTTNVTVTKAGSSIEPISPITIVYGDSTSISVIVVNATGVTAGLYSNGTLVDGKVSVDANVITIKGDVDVGAYTLMVTTVVDGNHESAAVTADVTVTKAGSSVSVPENISVDYGGSVNVPVVLENATGIVAELFDGSVKVKDLTVADNLVVLDVGGLESGSYVLRVATLTDGNHESAADVAVVEVLVHDADLKVFVEPSIKVDQNAVVNVTVDSRATGKVRITVNGETQTVDLVDAKGSAVFTGLTAGTYNVLAEYLGAGSFDPANATSEFTVYNYNATDLQALIDEAIANNQTSISLDHDYVFDENDLVPVNINAPISIDGNGHTIDASGTPGIFDISADDVSLSDMALTGVNGTAVVSTGDNTTVSDIILSDNEGTGIELRGDNAEINDVVVSDQEGTGIIVSGDDAVVSGVDIEGNDGTGIVIAGDDAVVSDVSVSDSVGTGIIVSGDDADVSDVEIDDNDGIGMVIAGDNAVVGDVSVSDQEGTGIIISGDDAVVSDVEVTGNNGTAMLINGDNAVVADSSFIGNTGEYGAGVVVNGDGATIADSLFENNTAETGAGILINGNDATVSGSAFTGNVAESGAGIFSNGDGTSVSACEFTGNVADAGAGMVVNGAGASVVDSNFTDNNASDYAAVILIGPEGSDVNVDNVNAVNNIVAGKENNTIVTQSSSISIVVVDTLEGEPITITVDVTGVGDYAFDGKVTIAVGNLTFTSGVVDGKAIFTVPGTLAAGLYDVSALYSGDSHRANSSASAVLGVLAKTTVIVSDITRGYNSPYDVIATFTDKYGAPLGNASVVFVVDGVSYTVTTDADGVGSLALKLALVNDSATNYTVSAVNMVTGENASFVTTIVPRLIVLSGDLTGDYLCNPAYVVQAIGDDGNPVGAQEFVTIMFAGFHYDRVTNESGIVERTIGLAPGMYAVYAVYKGYKSPQTVFVVKQVLKVSSGTLKKTAKKYTLKATLKYSNGTAIKGKVVKFTFNGKTYSVKTNSKGVASYTIKSSVIKKLKAGKTYVVKARYVNDIVKGKIRVR